MKKSTYKSYDDLPLCLNAEMVADVLDVSSTICYELMRAGKLPVLRMGSRLIVPKEKFLQWIEKKYIGRNTMNYRHYHQRDPIKNYFPLPNEIFSLGLSFGEIAVYAYLMYCEDRQPYQCYPSYSTIGRAIGMSRNTVAKYVKDLEGKQFITIEPTRIHTKEGRSHNGNLRYTIRPIEDAINYFHERQGLRH